LRLGAEAVTAATQEEHPAIRRRLGTLPLAKPVRLTVIRDGETIEIELTPREKGDVEGKELDCPRWDFTAKTINRFDNPALYFHRKEGVFVYGVRSPGNARDAGLRRNDILVRIDSQPVKTLEDVRNVHSAALENLAARHKIVVTVLRDGLMRHIVLDFSRDYERE
jgi:serine protease Do